MQPFFLLSFLLYIIVNTMDQSLIKLFNSNITTSLLWLDLFIRYDIVIQAYGGLMWESETKFGHQFFVYLSQNLREKYDFVFTYRPWHFSKGLSNTITVIFNNDNMT